MTIVPPKTDLNSPSLYNMIHEQLSSGLIIVSKDKANRSKRKGKLNLKFANKISVEQLNCSNESEVLSKFK